MSKVRYAEEMRVHFWCPGCDEAHCVTIGSEGWTFNNSSERPTFTPSVKVTKNLYGPNKESFRKYNGPFPCETTEVICHSYVTDGKIQFLNDCYHDMVGQTVELPEWPIDTHGYGWIDQQIGWS